MMTKRYMIEVYCNGEFRGFFENDNKSYFFQSRATAISALTMRLKEYAETFTAHAHRTERNLWEYKLLEIVEEGLKIEELGYYD